MTSRREFIHYTGATLLAMSAPPRALAGQHGQMMTREIPGTDERLAVVGLGNAEPFVSDPGTTGRLLDILIDHGGGYVDTSYRSRFTVGRLMREKNAQEQLFLGSYLEGDDPQALADEVKALQDVQGGGALDLVLSRDPFGFLTRVAEFQRLKEDGLARHVGVARHNAQYYPPIMQAMRDGVVDFVQVNYSMLEPGAADEVLPLAQEKNVAVIINRPFVNGQYFPLVAGHDLPEWAAEFDCGSWAQFSLKYIIAHPAVTCVITETSKPGHAIDNLGAGSGRLPDAATRERMRHVIEGLARS